MIILKRKFETNIICYEIIRQKYNKCMKDYFKNLFQSNIKLYTVDYLKMP